MQTQRCNCNNPKCCVRDYNSTQRSSSAYAISTDPCTVYHGTSPTIFAMFTFDKTCGMRTFGNAIGITQFPKAGYVLRGLTPGSYTYDYKVQGTATGITDVLSKCVLFVSQTVNFDVLVSSIYPGSESDFITNGNFNVCGQGTIVTSTNFFIVIGFYSSSASTVTATSINLNLIKN